MQGDEQWQSAAPQPGALSLSPSLSLALVAMRPRAGKAGKADDVKAFDAIMGDGNDMPRLHVLAARHALRKEKEDGEAQQGRDDVAYALHPYFRS
jgi:hypothetical protein